MSKAPFVLALLLFAALVPSGAQPAAASTRLAVFGDDGTTPDTQANVNGALADGAAGYLGLGDYYYWSAPATWKNMFAPLTSKGSHLALGNHDDHAAIADLMGPSTTWSKAVGGARIVALNTEQRVDVGSSQYVWARSELCNAAEPVRILAMHKGWWLLSGARHPGAEFPGSPSAMDALVQECGVDLVLAGHEHNYQRMVRGGVSYAVVGTGGQSLYPVAGSPAGTVASYQGYGRLLLDVSSTGLAAEFRALGGTVKDSFAAGSSPPGAAPGPASVTFTPRGGNEWWVQVAVGGASVASVDARDTGGAWVMLPKRSWGDHAGSFHVEPANLVTYRAKLADGTLVESCAYAHPSGPCSSAAPPPAPGAFDATFTNARGNTWWVEANVAATGGTLSGVDARVNGGAWVALAKQSWGSWAKSMSAPSSSTVEFRARATDGASDVSSAYAWPP